MAISRWLPWNREKPTPPPAPPEEDLYPDESRLELPDGYWLCFPSYDMQQDGVDYVRLMAADGLEIAYWIYDEWQQEPQLVMGAIMGAIMDHWMAAFGDPDGH